MLHLDTAGLSDIGKRRANQEDALLVDDEHGLYVVADGMGGHLAGEIASAMVADTLRAAACEPECYPPEVTDGSSAPEACRLLAWIRAANRNVRERSQRDEHCRGMGSTAAALLFANGRAVAANVGDSPVYRARGGRIEMLSAMHTVAADRAALDLQGLDLPVHFYHMLTRAVGIDAEVEPSILETDVCAGDIFIICSDGLSNALQPAEMLAVVQQAGAQKACEDMIALANARGGDDNITAIVIRVLRV